MFENSESHHQFLDNIQENIKDKFYD